MQAALGGRERDRPANWTGRPIADLELRIADPDTGAAHSLEHGAVDGFIARNGDLVVTLPLADVDVLLLRG